MGKTIQDDGTSSDRGFRALQRGTLPLARARETDQRA
jgi:hypothetical protein